MQQKEKLLFKRLCSFKENTFDETLLEAATPAVLGQLFFNRMHAVAYGTLKEFGLLGKVNREFRNSLKLAYDHNVIKNQSFFQCVEYVMQTLSGCQCEYAMLKGAYLCRLYPEGFRTSNDIDLLVHPKSVSNIGEALLKAGFAQGNIRNGKFEPATRREIIESKMTRGETVPYIKEINLPGMKFLVPLFALRRYKKTVKRPSFQKTQKKLLSMKNIFAVCARNICIGIKKLLKAGIIKDGFLLTILQDAILLTTTSRQRFCQNIKKISKS